MASITAVYEVGTETSNWRPVSALSAWASGWPVASTFWESTDGTNAMRMGFSREPNEVEAPRGVVQPTTGSVRSKKAIVNRRAKDRTEPWARLVMMADGGVRT